MAIKILFYSNKTIKLKNMTSLSKENKAQIRHNDDDVGIKSTFSLNCAPDSILTERKHPDFTEFKIYCVSFIGEHLQKKGTSQLT